MRVTILLLSVLLCYGCKPTKPDIAHRIDTTITVNQNFYYGYKSELPLPEKFSFNNSDNIVVNPFFNSFEIVGVDTGWGYVNFFNGNDTIYAMKVKVNRTMLYDSTTSRYCNRDTLLTGRDTVIHTKSILNAYHTFSLLNKPMPGFILKTIDGGSISNKDFQGHISMINFRDDNSDLDMEEQLSIKELQNRYKGTFIFYSFFSDSAFIKDNKQYYFSGYNNESQHFNYVNYEIDYPVAINSKNITSQFKFTVYPQTFIIDKSGVIRYILEGYNLDEKLKDMITDKIEFVMHHQ